MDRIETEWRRLIGPDDLVLLPGDISWAMRLEEAKIDLDWIDGLPGTKVMIRGNHDYWWGSMKKMAEILPPSIHALHNTAFSWNDVAVGGSRLWDTDEYRYQDLIHFKLAEGSPALGTPSPSKEEAEKIFLRELERLRRSLEQMNPEATLRVAMTHYPPIGADLAPSRAARILEEFKIDICVFGHLHNVKKGRTLFGEARGVKYILTAADYIDFIPVRLR